MNEPQNFVVVGASAGGLPVITSLVSQLKTEFAAAYFIVIHLAREASAEVILNLLQKNTTLQCILPVDKQLIERGCIYLAPPNHHLFIEKNKMRLTSGPAENRFRPSIDVTFRSAAAAYAARVTGIILTGLMNDGTAGMEAIKKSGGTCIVQEPDEAQFNAMPVSVLGKVDVDYQVPVNDIPFILEDIFARQAQDMTAPPEVITEAGFINRMASDIATLSTIGTHSNYTCPDCGGNLWRITSSRIPRYRCHTGHAYVQQVLLDEQTENLIASLWVSIRMIEEQRNLLLAVSAENTKEENSPALRERADQLGIHIERLKVIILTLTEN